MDFNHLWMVLEATLSPDNERRKAAEVALASYRTQPQFLTLLLRVVATLELPVPGRLAASIAFKNLVSDHWDHVRVGIPPLFSPEEKQSVRPQLLLATSCQVDAPIISSLLLSIRAIARSDFPDAWPTLPAEIATLLRSDDPSRVCNACSVLSATLRSYEHGEAQHAVLINLLTDACFPLMLHIARLLLASYNTPVAAAALRFILKAVAYASRFNLPRVPQLYVRDNFIAWCGVLNAVAGKHLPEPGEAGEPSGTPTSPDARQKWCWWRLKKWAFKLLGVYAESYGQPKTQSDAHMVEVATIFNKHVAPQVTGTVLQLLLGWRTQGRFVSDRVLLYSLHTLQTMMDFASCWKVLKPNMPFLLRDVCVHLYRFTAEEMELMTTDGIDYMRMMVDPMEQNYSPRAMATLFIHAAVNNRREVCSPIIDDLITEVVTAYASAPPAARDYHSMAAIFKMLEDLQVFMRGSDARRANMELLLTNFALPELQSAVPFMRARAIQLVTSFCNFGYKNKDVPLMALRGVVALLQDRDVVVRLTAGGALTLWIQHFKRASEVVAPLAVPIMEQLFSLLNEMGLDEVVTAVTMLLEENPTIVPSVAPIVIGRLITLFAELTRDVEEDGVTITDESDLASEGLLQCITAVVNVLTQNNHVAVLLQVLPSLWTLLDAMSVTSGPMVNFIDRTFGMLGEVVAALEERVADMAEPWILLRKQLHLYTECGLNYTSDMVYPVSTLMTFAPDRFVADTTGGVDTVTALLQVAQFVEAKSDEREKCRLGVLIQEMVFSLGHRIERFMPGIVQMYGKSMLSATTKYSRSVSATIIATTMWYSPALALAGLEAAGLTEAVFTEWSVAIGKKYYMTSLDCKMSMLGLASLLRTPIDALPVCVRGMLPQLLCGIVALQVRYEELLPEEAQKRLDWAEFAGEPWDDDDDDEDEDGEDDDDDAADDDAVDAAVTAAVVASVAAADNEEEDKIDIGKIQEEKEAMDEHARRVRNRHVDERGLRDGDSDLGDEPPNEKTCVDHVHQVLYLQEAVAALNSGPAGAAIQAAIPADVQGMLVALLDKAARLRAQGTQPGAFGPVADAEAPAGAAAPR